MNYRRNYVPGGTFFFTVVTAGRRPILTSDMAVGLLRKTVAEQKQRRPFDIVAAVILPDHLHMIWTLPLGDARYSVRWAAVKANFTSTWIARNGRGVEPSPSQRHKRYRGVWQPRFMEHTIRDEADLAEHVDYIHFNPVKHGLARRPVDWPYSSIHSYIRKGILHPDWGTARTKGEPGSGVSADVLE